MFIYFLLKEVPQKMKQNQQKELKSMNMMSCLMPLHLCFLIKAC